MSTQTIRVGSNGRLRLAVDVGSLVGSAVRDLIVKTAREALAEEVRNGFDPDPRTQIDGRWGAKIESVKPYGRIVLADRVNLGQAALETMTTMQRLARKFRKSGAYEASITIFVERTPVAPTIGAINAALRKQPDAALIIAPIVLYSRRLEKKYRTVDATHRLMERRFSGSMFVSKMTLYAGEIGSASRVMRNETGGKKLATPLSVEAAFPAVRIYRYAHVGTSTVQ